MYAMRVPSGDHVPLIPKLVPPLTFLRDSVEVVTCPLVRFRPRGGRAGSRVRGRGEGKTQRPPFVASESKPICTL
jgi:hypothetical protein